VGLFGVSVIIARVFLCVRVCCGVMIILQSLLAIQSFAKSPFWQLKFDILGGYLGPAAIIIIFGYLDSLSIILLLCCHSTATIGRLPI
jgi:hypothetical protein